MMKAFYYVLVLVLIFFRCIVIEAAKKKNRPKGDLTKDQIQSPTPGSNNLRVYTIEHTPPDFEEPSQKKSPPRKFQKEIDCDVSFE